ncbi:MAG TPA: cellulase family glycosylhydrolase, partial [Ktedonobacteraceae bacterium]|nr:cellulase family glycosylhydrolase [Ktedonobacteraceae bacterium]
MARKHKYLFSLVLCTLLIAGTLTFISTPRSAKAAVSVAGLHVSGNQILNGSGQVVRAVGVNRAGTEYECNAGGNTALFDGPIDANSLTALLSWSINTIRLPLNEDCWLGINGEPSAAYTSAQYQQAIINYVNQLTAANVIVILDLHWNAPGTQQSSGQQSMPDADHAPAFWTSVANTFKGNTSVIFDLYNEPFPTSWDCWLNGAPAANTSPCIGLGFPAVGMQSLVNTVRATGATNPIMLGGLAFSNDLSQWLQHKPNDPLNNLIASVHIYNFNACNSVSCWDAQNAPVAAQVPLVVGELGENDCAHSFIDTLMTWLDQHGASYLAWAWDTYNCSSFPALISDYSGTPTNYGIGFRDHLRSLNQGGGTPTPGTTPTPGITPTPTVGITPTPTPGITPTPITPTPISTPTPTPTPGITPTTGTGTACSIHYAITNQWQGGFGVTLTLTNTGTTAINGWTLRFTFPNGQTITQLWNGSYAQSGGNVAVTNLSYNGSLAPGGSLTSAPGFNGSWSSSN